MIKEENRYLSRGSSVFIRTMSQDFGRLGEIRRLNLSNFEH